MIIVAKSPARTIKVSGNRVAVLGVGRQGPAGTPLYSHQLLDVESSSRPDQVREVLVCRTAGVAKFDALSAADIQTGTLDPARLGQIDATKIANGSVDNTEFQALNGVTSSIQTQLDGKAASVHQHSGSDITSGTVSAARLGSGTPTSSTVLDGTGTWRAISNDDLPTGLSAGSGYGFTDPDAFALGTYGDGIPNTAKPGITCAGLASGGSIIHNCPSAKTHNFLVGGNLNFLLGSGLGSIADTNWAIGRYGVAGANAAYNGIAGNGTSIYYNAGTGGGHSIRVGNTVVALVQSGGLTMSSPITLGNAYTLTAAANQVVGTASGPRLQAATGSNAGLAVGGTDRLTVSATLATLSVPLISPTSTPASATAAGTAGQWSWDTSYIYICTAANTWRRVAHATW